MRELGSEVAILSEPYRAESSSDWVTDRTGKAALWLCGVSVPPMRDTRAVEGFVRANLASFRRRNISFRISFVLLACVRSLLCHPDRRMREVTFRTNYQNLLKRCPPLK